MRDSSSSKKVKSTTKSPNCSLDAGSRWARHQSNVWCNLVNPVPEIAPNFGAFKGPQQRQNALKDGGSNATTRLQARRLVCRTTLPIPEDHQQLETTLQLHSCARDTIHGFSRPLIFSSNPQPIHSLPPPLSLLQKHHSPVFLHRIVPILILDILSPSKSNHISSVAINQDILQWLQVSSYYVHYLPARLSCAPITASIKLKTADLRLLNVESGCTDTGPASSAPPPLAPSVEEAYRRKCIQLKQRTSEVEESNDAARLRLARLKRQVEKMRIERAYLLEQLAKRTSANVEDSDGSPSPPPTVCVPLPSLSFFPSTGELGSRPRKLT